MKFFLCLISIFLSSLFSFAQNDGAKLMQKYAYSWSSPSTRESDSMPIGNGDLAANVYADNGAIYLLLSKSDNYDGVGNLLKVGRIKISTNPNFLADPKNFKQTLDIKNGKIDIVAGGATFRIWTDFNNPVWRVDAQLPSAANIVVEPVLWSRGKVSERDRSAKAFNSSQLWLYPTFWKLGEGSTEDLRADTSDSLQWWRKNTKSAFKENMSMLRIANAVSTPDPLIGFVSATRVEAKGLINSGGKLVGNAKNFTVKISTAKENVDSPESVFESLKTLLAKDDSNDWGNHKKSWANFWNRSWICLSDNSVEKSMREIQSPDLPFNALSRTEPDGGFIVAQHYNIARYMMACQSRGKCQTPFNGGIFTTPISYSNKSFSEDERLWGRGFTFQNQRLLYWPMIHAGDTDLIQPFFNYYLNLLEIRKAITKMWFGHDGAFFREYMPLAGDDIGDHSEWEWKFNKQKNIYEIVGDGKLRESLKMPAISASGKQQARPEENISALVLPSKVKIGDLSKCGYHNFHTNSGIEIVQMMLAYCLASEDEKFFSEKLLPFAKEILKYYELHFPRESDGKLWLEPTQSVETYWYTKNDMPDVAGLTAVLRGLLENKNLNAADRKYFEKLLGEVPAIPVKKNSDGGEVLLAAEKIFTGKHNVECPELYAVFPYNLYGTATKNEFVVRNTMPVRTTFDAMQNRCWAQDEMFYAYAGLADEAAKRLERRFRSKSENMRFPMFARENPDHVPDFDHNGSGSVALQKMLVQESGERIVLLPAWPAKWDCNFKLHLSKKTTISGSVKNGVLQAWSITPSSRIKDVEVRAPQAVK